MDSILTGQKHPWHGISPFIKEGNLNVIQSYIEIVPLDTVKYEIDKASGHLKIDRPHKYSSLCPTLYGFIPQTYCNNRVADEAKKRTGKTILSGDHDPLDICVLTERPITHGGILATVKVIGGFCLLDKGEADDKIVAVLDQDHFFDAFEDISQVPSGLIDRLKHYFLTYKEIPHDAPEKAIEITDVYGKKEAEIVIQKALEDYAEKFNH